MVLKLLSVSGHPDFCIILDTYKIFLSCSFLSRRSWWSCATFLVGASIDLEIWDFHPEEVWLNLRVVEWSKFRDFSEALGERADRMIAGMVYL